MSRFVELGDAFVRLEAVDAFELAKTDCGRHDAVVTLFVTLRSGVLTFLDREGELYDKLLHAVEADDARHEPIVSLGSIQAHK